MQDSTSAAPGTAKPGISFAGFRLEEDGMLFRGNTPIHLPPKELAALRLLLANAGRVVTSVQLRQALWGDVHVSADSVPKCVSSLRARLEPGDCIQTVYKRGYRFSAELTVSGAGPDGAPLRLAILPFVGGFGVPDYLGAGIAEEAMARLSGARPATIAVLAQDSVFTLARRGFTALEVGRQLKADTVLAGSLRALPMHYRLRAEMIRVSDGTQLWVEDMLVERSRVSGLETEIVNRLVVRLGGSVAIRPRHALAETSIATETEDAAPPADLAPSEDISIAAVADSDAEDARREAYEIYLRAHHEWQSLERHRMQDGLQHLLRATELDPCLTEARVDLVHLCVTQGLYGFMSPSVAADISRRAAQSIPETDARAETVQPALGWIRFHFERSLPDALADFAQAAHLKHDPWITRARSTFALSRHRFDEALGLIREALDLDPYSPWLNGRLAWALHLAGDADASMRQAQATLTQFPDHAGTNLYGSMILAFNGEAERAVEVAQGLAQRLPYFDLATEAHAYTLACSGHTEQAHTILERLQWLGRERFLLRAFTPAVYVALGDFEAALAELRVSNEIRCPWFFQTLADPRLKPLQSHPGFQELLAILTGMEAEVDCDEQMLA